MPVKRSLKLDDHFQENSSDPSKLRCKRSMTAYSPTTGTCRISLLSSPTTSEEKMHRATSSLGKRNKQNHPSLIQRKDSTTKENDENDELMMLLSKVEQSSEEIMEVMQSLRSIQALKGNRELENLIGISPASCFLKGEVEKTKKLMAKAIKQKLFKKKNSGLPHKEHHLDSYEFLKAILN